LLDGVGVLCVLCWSFAFFFPGGVSLACGSLLLFWGGLCQNFCRIFFPTLHVFLVLPFKVFYVVDPFYPSFFLLDSYGTVLRLFFSLASRPLGLCIKNGFLLFFSVFLFYC